MVVKVGRQNVTQITACPEITFTGYTDIAYSSQDQSVLVTFSEDDVNINCISKARGGSPECAGARGWAPMVYIRCDD